jgi:serine/threonine protein kinase
MSPDEVTPVNSPSTHPSTTDLTAFAYRRLTPGLMRSVEDHVAGCNLCFKIVTVLRQRQQVISTPGPAANATDEVSSKRNPVAPPVSIEEVPEFLRDHPRYEIVKKLGAGGMGVVFLARHKVMDRDVAIKLMAAKYQDHQQAIDRFYREIKTVARLDHPNIARAYDAEQAADFQMLVMEFVDGRDLERIVRRKGPLPIGHACHYIRQACRGLQHAHEQGMVHRDLKPSNLMLTRSGYIKILDFGLARFVSEQQLNGQITQQDGPMGTPCFLSPEQALKPIAADIRSDIYSLGCTLFHLLAGRPPFTGETKYQVITAHLKEPPPSIREFRSEVPDALWAVIKRLLDKDPNRRPQTPEELAELMQPFVRTGRESTKNSQRNEGIPVLPIVGDPEELLEAEIVSDPEPARAFPRAMPIRKEESLPTLEPIEPLPPPAPNNRKPRINFDDNAPPPLPRNPAGPRFEREPAPPPPRSAGWGMKLLAVLVFLLFLGGMGAIAYFAGLLDGLVFQKVTIRERSLKPDPHTTHRTDRYLVRFPGKGELKTERNPLSLAKTSLQETGIRLDANDAIWYTVSEAPIIGTLRSMSRDQLEKLLSESFRSPSIRSEFVRLPSNQPGLELSGKTQGLSKPGPFFRARVFVIDDRIYRLIARSTDSELLRGKEVSGFLDSFELVER